MDIKQSSEKRFALLIDADNVSAKYIKPITDELSKYGTVTYKRIYGDWTLTLHAKWKDALLENSITPIQQFGYTQGKNATDSAMIIDAMDILYTRSVEGFCIVSSDSDFTRLASRIRESGLTVIGMGEKKTPTPFRKACDIFTTLELLLGDTGGKSGGRNRNRHDQGSSSNGQGAGTTTMSKDEIEQAVVNIITDNQNNGKSTGLGEVGSRLLKRYPDFDVRSYGTNLLSKLLDEFASVQIIKDGSSVAVVLAEGANAPKDASPEAEQAPETKQADDVKDAPVAESEGSTDAQGAAEAKPVEKKPASRRQPRRRKDQVAAQQGSEATEEKPVQEPELSAEPAGEQHDRLAEPVVEAEPAEQPPSDNRPGRAARMRAAASRSRGSEGRKQAGKKQTEKGKDPATLTEEKWKKSLAELSLKPVAARLSELLGREVIMAADVVGPDATAKAAVLKPGQILLLENTRFEKGETKNDPELARKMAAMADVYVSDAFGAVHRAHASTAGVAAYLPAVSGFLIQKELEIIGGALANPKRPLVAILGGSKVSSKIGVINNLLEIADTIIIGGGKTDKEVKFILDGDFSTAGKHNPDAVPEKLERMHRFAVCLFQGAITKELHEAMGPTPLAE